ncbi:hypothetical protein LX87_05515 [Larkinella arboricola]|uniref:Uncharacterized protein n=1 Tax=Larkinella arboricola TaxID=643671 RepID=A0A327WP20_LARAB|nr:hypothetical protein [Larkinella arboricola]RAJ90086.1 hypothetical protein LX87_05515 [Larkinella arboricola]
MSTNPFKWIFELISITSGGLTRMTSSQLGLTFLAAIAITALCAWICLHYVQLWNKRFRLTTTHKVLTALACTLTFFFVLAYAGLSFMKEITAIRISLWQTMTKLDHAWARETLAKTYDAVKEGGFEDFSRYPSPDSGVPITKSESRLIAAEVNANEASRHFSEHHPFLSKIIWTHLELPTKIVKEDVEEYFKEPSNRIYPQERAIDLAAEHIKTQLMQQTPRVVTLSRIALVLAFIIVQLIPFGLIGYAAYKDIKVLT